MNKRMFKRALTIAMACMLALCAAGLAEQLAVVTAKDDAAVYDAHGVQLGTLPAGTALTVTGVRAETSGGAVRIIRTEKEAPR